MRIFSLFFLIGTLIIQFLEKLPSVFYLLHVALVLVLILVFFLKKSPHFFKSLLLISLGLYLGIFISTIVANNQIKNRLINKHEGKDIVITGTIKDIPDNREDGIRFKLDIIEAYLKAEPEKPIKIRGVARLGWYRNIQEIHPDETWQIQVRLKQPSGFMNPGGFDYEKWLFTQRIIATGYVRKSDQNRRLLAAPDSSINLLREKINTSIHNRLENNSSAAVLSALMVAIRTDLKDTQWKTLQKTGTSHLIAISGLHIAIVAGFAFFPIMLIWRLIPRLNEIIPVMVAGSVASAIFATSYALLAGFTIPTQRALLMVLIMLIGMVHRRNHSSSVILATAILVVLLFDPLAAMTISFWLSFFAVTFILIILKRQQKQKSFLRIFQLQLLLSLGMFPLTLLFFGSGSLASPIANLLAIPWVTFFIVPVGLIGVLLLPFSDVASGLMFEFAALAIEYLFYGLELLSSSSLSSVNIEFIPSHYLILLIVGIVFLLLPKGFPARWLGFIAILPAALFVNKTPEYGAFSFTLLDAGQGMASVVHTKSHTLIYDTGTRVSDRFDIGKLVVIPYLKSKGINKVDRMILSHDNLDHRGGAKSIIEEISVDKVISSDLQIVKGVNVEECIAGQSWKLDGVDFEILSPEENSPFDSNDQSCVLRVSNKYHSLLLTGDIEKKAEKVMVRNYPKKVISEVISVPHHGSKTSSTFLFLESVLPSLAVIPAGYRNRFGHPKKVVVNRYKTLGIETMSTIKAGAINIKFPASDNGIITSSYRLDNKHFWNR